MASKSKKKQSKQGRPPYRAVLYLLDKGTQQGDAVREVLSQAGIPIRTIGEEQLADTAGFHGGVTGYRANPLPYDGKIPNEPFMLLCNVPSKMMDTLLQSMRDSGCTVDCKAVLTTTNRNWRMGDLILAVADEHKTMTASPEQG